MIRKKFKAGAIKRIEIKGKQNRTGKLSPKEPKMKE